MQARDDWMTPSGSTATKLAITTEPPSSVQAGSRFGLVVTAEDSGSAVDPTFTGVVTIALASNPGSATLSGVLSIAAVAGVATFAGLTLNVPHTGYTIGASSGSLTSATSTAITVTAPPSGSSGILDLGNAGDVGGLVIATNQLNL
jgi:hypothetical protein